MLQKLEMRLIKIDCRRLLAQKVSREVPQRFCPCTTVLNIAVVSTQSHTTVRKTDFPISRHNI